MILNSIIILHVQIPNGIAISASTLVGSAIGEGNIPKAKSYARMIIVFGLTLMFACQCLIVIFKQQVASLFTADAKVQECILNTLFWVVICMCFDGLVTILIGVIKGIGKQVPATIAYVICFYLISVPCSYIFCFMLKFGQSGLWMGNCVGLTVLVIALFAIICKADWEEISMRAKEKILKEALLM